MSEQPIAAETIVRLPASEYHALLESRRMFAMLLSNLPGMAYRFGTNGDYPFEFVSEGCYELTGYPAEELLSGRITWAQLCTPEELARTQRLSREAVQQRKPYQFT